MERHKEVAMRKMKILISYSMSNTDSWDEGTETYFSLMIGDSVVPERDLDLSGMARAYLDMMNIKYRELWVKGEVLK